MATGRLVSLQMLQGLLDVSVDDVAFCALSVGGAFVGWGMVYLSARFERERQERHAERFGEYPKVSRIVRGPDGAA